jgi:type I restriction enzyme M protein
LTTIQRHPKPTHDPPARTDPHAHLASRSQRDPLESLRTFRGTVDPSEYKNYILVMLFVKYVSDVWHDYRNHHERVDRAMSREPFKLPPGTDFQSLYTS